MSTETNDADQQGSGSSGVCIWLTGRSGAGKTTVTDVLVPELERAGRTVTVLDTVPLLAKGPGEKTSEPKLLRKAFVASEVVRHGGVVICVTVSARRAVRERARMIVGDDHFVEVFFDVPLEVAEARRRSRGSRRPLRKAIRNVIKSITRPVARQFSEGQQGGYEASESPEVTLDALHLSPTESAERILTVLRARGVLPARS